MNFIKRSGLSVIHNIRFNILLLMLFTVIATLILSGLCIQSASAQQCLAIRRELGSEIVLAPNIDKLGNGIPVPLDAISRISKLKHVDSSNFILSAKAQPIDFKETSDAISFASKSKDTAMLLGLSQSETYDNFSNGSYTLTSGRHFGEIDQDTPCVMIDQVLAKQDALKTGDKITLKVDSNRTEAFTIVGIYQNNKQGSISSELLMPYTQLMHFVGTTDLSYAVYFLDDPLNIDIFKNEVNKLDLPSLKGTQIEAQDAVYRRLAGPINNMNLISVILVVGVIIAGLVILSLMLMLNLRGRKFEIGVLLSLGEYKSKIILQMVLEILLPVLLAFTLSIACGRFASQRIGAIMLSSQAQSQSVGSGQNANVIKASDTGKTYAPIQRITVSITKDEIVELYIAGFLLVLFSTLIPMSIVMRYHPKDILILTD